MLVCVRICKYWGAASVASVKTAPEAIGAQLPPELYSQQAVYDELKVNDTERVVPGDQFAVYTDSPLEQLLVQRETEAPGGLIELSAT